MNVEDAERAFLGAWLQGAELQDDLGLRGEDFSDPSHEKVFVACQRVAAAGQRVRSMVPVRVALAQERLPKDAGVYLADLVEACPVAASIDYYAQMVVEAADRRTLRVAALRVQQLAEESDRSSADLLEDARAMLDKAPQRGVSDGATWADVFPRVMDYIESGQTAGLSLPWPDLDRELHGLKPGWVYLVAARPGVGKSVLGQNIATHVACKHRQMAVVVSLEMSEADLGMRIVADLGSISLGKLIDNNLNEFDEAALSSVMRETHDMPLTILDNPTQTFAQIRSAVRAIARRTPIGVVVVDYLQLIQARDPRAPREQQVAEFSRQLKVLARELKVPVVALAQLNRGPEQRADKKPILSDLRESGSQEQDADIVLLLWRDEELPGETQVMIAKNRHGAQKHLRLDFYGHYARLRSITGVRADSGAKAISA